MIEHREYGKSLAQCINCDCDEPPCQAAQDYAKTLERVHRRMLDSSFEQTKDSVALQSTAHPTPSWWRRIFFWFWRPRLSDDAIETVELDRSRVSKTGLKIDGPKP